MTGRSKQSMEEETELGSANLSFPHSPPRHQETIYKGTRLVYNR